MSPEEITAAYDTLAQEVATYGANEAASIGNAQRSLGTLAERVASPSGQTSGLANYTYNRTMRPTIDSTVASITTTGKSQALTQALNDALRAARKSYEDAQRNYQRAVSNATTNGNNNRNGPNVNRVGDITPGYTGNAGSGGDGEDNGGDNDTNGTNTKDPRVQFWEDTEKFRKEHGVKRLQDMSQEETEQWREVLNKNWL